MIPVILTLAGAAVSCLLAAFLLLVRDVCADNALVAENLADRQARAIRAATPFRPDTIAAHKQAVELVNGR